MKYNLTENQKNSARAIVKAIRDDGLPETFVLNTASGKVMTNNGRSEQSWPKMDLATLKCIKHTGEELGLEIIRADENEFHADLWGNVRTHLHGCGFGIAIYERIETNEPNANVGLEVGYLMAMNKPVLLLKDKTVETLQADLAGKLYKQFDPHDPEATIPAQLTKWLEDYGIVVPNHP